MIVYQEYAEIILIMYQKYTKLILIVYQEYTEIILIVLQENLLKPPIGQFTSASLYHNIYCENAYDIRRYTHNS